MTASRNSSFHTMSIGPLCSAKPLSVLMVVVALFTSSVTVAVSLECAMLSESRGGSFARAAPVRRARRINGASAVVKDFKLLILAAWLKLAHPGAPRDRVWMVADRCSLPPSAVSRIRECHFFHKKYRLITNSSPRGQAWTKVAGAPAAGRSPKWPSKRTATLVQLLRALRGLRLRARHASDTLCAREIRTGASMILEVC